MHFRPLSLFAFCMWDPHQKMEGYTGRQTQCSEEWSNLWSFLIKVIIEKSRRGEVSLMEQDTIENVSKPIKFLKKIIFLILSEKTILFYATF